MGAWGTGLYAGDFAADLRAAIGAAARLPLDEDGLVEAICAGDQRRHGWRRPDGKFEWVVYPPRPTIAELMESA